MRKAILLLVVLMAAPVSAQVWDSPVFGDVGLENGGVVAGDLVPDADCTRSLGLDPTPRWGDINACAGDIFSLEADVVQLNQTLLCDVDRECALGAVGRNFQTIYVGQTVGRTFLVYTTIESVGTYVGTDDITLTDYAHLDNDGTHEFYSRISLMRDALGGQVGAIVDGPGKFVQVRDNTYVVTIDADDGSFRIDDYAGADEVAIVGGATPSVTLSGTTSLGNGSLSNSGGSLTLQSLHSAGAPNSLYLQNSAAEIFAYGIDDWEGSYSFVVPNQLVIGVGSGDDMIITKNSITATTGLALASGAGYSTTVDRTFNVDSGALLVDTTAGDVSTTGQMTADGYFVAYSIKSSSYTMDAGDGYIEASGTIPIHLPTASGIAGRMYGVGNAGSGTVTLTGYGSETINGNLTQDLLPDDSISVISNGTNWRIR